MLPFLTKEIIFMHDMIYIAYQISTYHIDIVNIGLHFILKNVRPYAASCSEA